jgi:hypothetical protein
LREVAEVLFDAFEEFKKSSRLLIVHWTALRTSPTLLLREYQRRR